MILLKIDNSWIEEWDKIVEEVREALKKEKTMKRAEAGLEKEVSSI